MSSLIRNSAAAVTLIVGVFAIAVRFGPMVAPVQHEAAMITLASAFGQDIGPVTTDEAMTRLAAY